MALEDNRVITNPDLIAANNKGYVVGRHPVSRPDYDTWFKTVPSDRKDTSSYNLRRAYELAPMDELEAWRTSSVADLEAGRNHLRSVYENPATGEYEFMKSRNHPTLQYELDWYNGDSDDAKDFRDKYALDTSGEYYKYIPRGRKESSEQSVRPNMFKGLTNQQQRNMTYSADELDRGYKSVVPNQQVQPTVDPLSGHESVGHGSEVAMPRQVERMTATPKVQTVAQAPQYSQPRPQITSMDELAAAMGYTSPEEEARLRKASVNNQRILAVADALRHIGNIANTANYAPSQQFNRPWAEEQARYEQGKAMRDKANSALFAYQRQRAEQERAERKLDAQIKKQEADAERSERWNQARIDRINAQNAKTDDERYLLQTRARLMEQGWPLDKANKEAQIALRKEQTRLAKVKADQGGFAPKKGSNGGSRVRRVGGGKGGGYEFYDKNGVRHTAKTVTELDAKLQEYAPEIAASEEYVKGVDALNRPVKGNRRISAGRRAGNANRKYRPGSKGRGSNNSGFFNS